MIDDLEEPESKGGAPEWMVTFADLMSLLLTFFVLLLSFSNMEIVKFRTMAGSVRNALGLKSEFDLSDIPKGNELLPHEDPKEGEGGPADRELEVRLTEALEDAGLEDSGEVRVDDRGVILRLSGDLLFDSGESELKPAAFSFLDRLAGLLMSEQRSVDVGGHTDNVPISTPVYPSNWELSAARAGQAVRYLVENGVRPGWLRAIGYAHTAPLASNDSAEGRALNRRVEFIFAGDSKVLPDQDFKPGTGQDSGGSR